MQMMQNYEASSYGELGSLMLQVACCQHVPTGLTIFEKQVLFTSLLQQRNNTVKVDAQIGLHIYFVANWRTFKKGGHDLL